MPYEFPEKDWKLLRRLKPQLLDRYCDRVLHHVAEMAKGTAVGSHERYLKLYQYLKERDRILASGFNDQRRSNALAKIAAIHAQGLFTDEEFAQFSEETRGKIAPFPKRAKRSVQNRSRKVHP